MNQNNYKKKKKLNENSNVVSAENNDIITELKGINENRKK